LDLVPEREFYRGVLQH